MIFLENHILFLLGLILLEDMLAAKVFPYGDIFQDLIRYILVSFFFVSEQIDILNLLNIPRQ